MNSADFLTTLGTTCKRYGPGRLPRAERHDIGAGYALASAATGATLLFALISWSLYTLGEPIGSDWKFLGTWALIALPLVVPASFISAVIVWRTLPSDTPYFGASAGVLAALGTYILALLALFAFSMIALVINGQYTEIPEALGFMVVIGFVALASTFWLTFPIGAISGIIHERVTLNGTKRT
ncbi:hypothetical protein [Haloferax denitrificans]|uniref:Uncharacterized protein n=1 Tax=Haloferax denitrificans ATCC 35960 TaxID=662478 RepID=M0JEW6_9EURY|nr:hypothetical protein [Haloferax denitrificans]EMA06908.1 hypothetical protein C438_05127 [Haloferax denitrificans ATCC 35960]